MFSLLLRFFAGNALKTPGGEIRRGFGWVFSTPVHLLEAALLITLAFGLWERAELAHARADARQCAKDRAADKAAYVHVQNEATARAIAQRTADERHYKELSDAAQANHQSDLESARAMADRAVAAGRLRLAEVFRAASGAPAKAEGGGASLPAGLPSGAVMVDGADVQACTALYPYALDAHDWAVSLHKDQ